LQNQKIALLLASLPTLAETWGADKRSFGPIFAAFGD
jgi:hypothetical protein